MEKILHVVQEQNSLSGNNWYCNFYVHSLVTKCDREHVLETTVMTIDVFTYKCQTCETNGNEECIHVNAVKKYVCDEMDKTFRKKENTKGDP